MSDQVRHQRIKINGIWMHIAEQGTGPLVLLLHGFPQFWYSWRHQMGCLANKGYHVVAPDMRGYGDTDSPVSPTSYTVFHLVGDIIGLIDHFGEQKVLYLSILFISLSLSKTVWFVQFDKVVVVGADWGAVAAWHLSLFRPDRVKGLVCLCVPFKSRHPAKPTEFFTQTFGDGFYITQFQVSFLSLSIHACDAYAVHLYGIVLSIGTGKSREGICKI